MHAARGKADPTNLLDFNLNGSMTLSGGQVAHLLGLSEPTFRRRVSKGELPNFPGRLPGVGKWSKPAVVAWISSNGELNVARPRGIPFGDPEIEALVTELEQDYGAARVA